MQARPATVKMAALRALPVGTGLAIHTGNRAYFL